MTTKTECSGHAAPVSLEASQKTKNLGFLCSILVVAYHIAWPREIPLSAGWFIHQGIADGVAKTAVPFFFVVSGFFLARHFREKGWWRREVRKRVYSLLLPFFLWSLIALLVSLLLPAIGGILNPCNPLETEVLFPRLGDLPAVFGLDFSTYPLNFPLWYLRGLFVLVVLSFAVERLVSGFGRAWLASAFFFLLTCWRIPVGHWSICLFHVATGLFYFSAGMAIQMENPFSISTRTGFFAGLAGLALLAVKMASAAKEWHFQYEFLALSLPFLLVAEWTFVPKSKWPAPLTSCAFPVFLAHIPAIRLATPFLSHMGLGGLPFAFAQLSVGVVFPCAIAWILRRHAPGTSAVLFGGR